MIHQCLDTLSILSIEKTVFDLVSENEIIDRFLSMKNGDNESVIVNTSTSLCHKFFYVLNTGNSKSNALFKLEVHRSTYPCEKQTAFALL